MSGNSVLDKDQSAKDNIRPEFLPDGSHDNLEMSDEARQAEADALNGSLYNPNDGAPLSNKDLQKAEIPTTPAESSSSAGSSEDIGFSEEEPRGIRARISGMSKKAKAGILTGVVGGMVGVGGFMGIGTLQLIHLANILNVDGKPAEADSEVRVNALYRYAKSGGDARELRMTFLGSKKFHNSTIPRLDKIGITFETDKTLGIQKKAFIDFDKNPITENMKNQSQDAKIKALARNLNINTNDIKVVNGKAEIDLLNKRTGSWLRSLNKNFVKQLPNGSVSRWITMRNLSKAFKIPNMWHPLQKADTKASRAALTWDAKRKAAKGETYKSTKAGDAYRRLQENTKGVKAGAGAALLVASSVCLARDSAEDAILLNREAIVLPTAGEAARMISIGSQQQSGMDFDPSQLNVINQTLSDEQGRTIWQSAAMKSGNSVGGTEVPQEYKQAFSGSSSAQSLKELTDKAGGEHLCSTTGKIAQGVTGAVLLGLSIPTGGASAVAFGSVKLAAGVAGGVAVMVGLQKLLTESLKDGELPDNMPADVRGGMLKLGSRELANMGARTTGGVELSAEESAMIDRQIIQDSQDEFNSKPFLAKVFDAKDYRSVTGTLARSSGSVKSDIKNVAQGLFNIGPMFANTLSNLSPKAKADTTTYDYGFNRYGIPKRIIDNPAYDDPYANAEVVAGILNGGSGQGYIDRAKKCFNISVSKDNGMWEVTPEEGDVNPNSSEYQDAKCNEASDGNWDRMILFVFDNMTMEALACYLGEDESCTKLGANATDGSESSDGSGGKARVATFNVFFKGDTSKNVKTIRDQKLDVVGLQEVRQSREIPKLSGILEGLNDEYESYPTPAGYNQAGYGAQNPIIWKKSTVEMVPGSGKSIPGYSINGGKKPDAVIQVKLRLKSTGQEFYFINHHEPVGKGSAIQQRYDSANLRAEYVQKLDAPVFLTGDFNSKYGTLKAHEMNQPPLGNKVENLGYCILTAEETNLWDAFDAEKNLSGKCPSANKDGRPGIVDHIYMSREIKVKEGSYNNKFDAPANGSDVHPMVFADIEFPGGGKGSGENITAATYNIQAIGLGGSVAKTKNAAKLMKAEGVSVFGAQEVRMTQFDTVKSEGWGGVVSSPDGRAIFWDKNKFTMKRSGEWMITKDGQRKPMIWAELDGGGEKPLYVFNLHTDPSRENTAIRTQSARETLAEIKKVIKDDSIPFIVTGDMNSNYTDRREVYNVFKTDLLLTYNETKNRIGAECDTVGSKDPRAQQCGSKTPASHIDHIYISKTAKIEVQSWKNIADKNTLAISDHNPVLVSLRIPSIAAPQDSSATGSAVMGDDYKNPLCEQFRAKGAPGLSCNGQCVDFVKFRLKKHINRDSFTSLGNGKDVVIGLGRSGYKVNNKPAVNSVVSWGAGQFGMNGTFGHTAMVSKVNSDGSIVVEEYNVKGGSYSTRKISADQASQLAYAHTEVDYK